MADENGKRKVVGDWSFLDQFSTSQTFPSKTTETNFDLWPVPCINHAPYFAFKKENNVWGVVQGCCNSWTCPRCGILRAKQEYGRIVEGCRELRETHDLYFITITCRGKEMSLDTAEKSYLQWTNKLLTRWRSFAARHHQKWSYVQVTERQKRMHPHSHIITTWKPPDVHMGKKRKWKIDAMGYITQVEVDALVSNYVRKSCIASGLGDQYDISRVQSVEGASRYVAKYLFKPTIFTTTWPKGWKRVRYSQSFPRLDKTSTSAFVLLTREDWNKLARLAPIITVNDYVVGEIVAHNSPNSKVLFKPVQKVDKT